MLGRMPTRSEPVLQGLVNLWTSAAGSGRSRSPAPARKHRTRSWWRASRSGDLAPLALVALCAALACGPADSSPVAGELARVDAQRAGSGQADTFPQVEVFLTDWCPYCRKLETFLQENDVPYARLNVEEDPEAGREFQRLGGGGIPLTRIGGATLVRGANLDEIGELIGLP